MFIGRGPAIPRIACACVAGLLSMAAAQARADIPTSVVVSTGQYGMRKEIPHALGIELQVRPPLRWWLIRPAVGLLTTANGGAYFFSGVVLEVPLPLNLVLSPGFAPGVLVANGEGDLGSPIEFRSSLQLDWTAASALRVGVVFSHISNARLGDRNPGVEVLMLSLVFPGRD